MDLQRVQDGFGRAFETFRDKSEDELRDRLMELRDLPFMDSDQSWEHDEIMVELQRRSLDEIEGNSEGFYY